MQPLLPNIQLAILRTFTHSKLGDPCECGDAKAVFRCTECYLSPLWCRQCIVRQHRYTPFHHIEKWNGNLFVRASLASPPKLPKPKPNAKVPAPANPKPKTRSAGVPAPPASAEEGVAAMVLQTCRESNGQPCPNIDPRKANETREFTIADHNGFHIRQLQFCRCRHPEKDDKDYEQLLAVRLFPATFTHPQTAFTFTVMKQFHIHTLASKKLAYDYVKALCMLTDNASNHDVTVSLRLAVIKCNLTSLIRIAIENSFLPSGYGDFSLSNGVRVKRTR